MSFSDTIFLIGALGFLAVMAYGIIEPGDLKLFLRPKKEKK